MADDGMIDIDGSVGEGGGQILRTAFAMSAITGKPVNIRNIRADRPKPGLASQHLTAIKAVTEICNGELEGAYKGSERVSFHPGNIEARDMELDIGTAGSISLVLQAILPVLARAHGESNIRIRGGTDVKWSPPVDHLRNTLLPIYKDFGIECELDVIKRGYYPKGGGEVHICIRSQGEIDWAIPDKTDEPVLSGMINITGLPRKIAERMRNAAMNELDEFIEPGEMSGPDIIIDHRENGASQGIGILLTFSDGKRNLGVDILGERGVPAEVIGKKAANRLIELMDSGADIDEHGADQIMTLMAISGSSPAFIFPKMTSHISTNLNIIGRFMPDILNIAKDNNSNNYILSRL